MNKRDLLLETSLTLFYEKGVHAVGINEILSCSGVAKKTLYNYFDSKEALILACVQARDLRFMAWLNNRCSNKASLSDFIIAFFDALNDWINSNVVQLGEFNGCFFVNVSAEYNDESSLIYLQCLTHKNNVRLFIQQQLLTFKQINTQEKNLLLNTLMLLKEGCINCAFVLGDKASANKAKTVALQLLPQ